MSDDTGQVSTTRQPSAWEVDRRPLMVAAVAVLSVKFLCFAIDRVPLLFMGDSRAYVYSAVFGDLALDRSNTYGWLIWVISVLPGTLTTLVLAQTLAGAVTAWLLAFCLLRYFKVRPVIAIVTAVAFAVEPLQILHERMVLTESFAVLMLAVYLVVSLSYLARPRALTLIALAVTGVLLLSLRLLYIPVTIFGAVLIPLLGWVLPHGEWALPNGVRRFPAHLVLSLFVTFGLHQVYKTVTGLRANLPPAYQYADGLFLASAWAPLIEPEDAVDPRARRVVEELLAGTPYPLRDFHTRYRQLWGEEGLTRKMIDAFGDGYSANVAAQQLSRRTLRRVPLSVVRLAVLTYASYWQSPATMHPLLRDEQGTSRGPEPEFVGNLKEWFNLDAAEIPAMMTPSKRYHLHGALWYVALTLSPLVGLLSIPLSRREARPGALLIAVVGATLLVVMCASSVNAAIRYLHPLAFGMLLALAVITDGVARRFMRLTTETLVR